MAQFYIKYGIFCPGSALSRIFVVAYDTMLWRLRRCGLF